ncbi:MAG: hypothetical protein ABIQ59_03750 [Nocardioidaceae bacterium]
MRMFVAVLPLEHALDDLAEFVGLASGWRGPLPAVLRSGEGPRHRPRHPAQAVFPLGNT